MKKNNNIKQMLIISNYARKNNFYEIMLVCLTLWAIILLGVIIPFWGIGISFLIMSVITIGQKKVILNSIRAKGVIYEDLFSEFKQFIKIILLKLVVLLSILVWTLCFILPGIVCGLNYVFVSYVLAENPTLSVRECLRKSEELTNNNRPTIFILILSMLLLMIIISSLVFGAVMMFNYFIPMVMWLKISLASIFSVCLWLVFVIPYYEIAFASLYISCCNSNSVQKKSVKSASV